MELKLDNLTVRISGNIIIADVSIDVPHGRTVGLIGPNGSGKSTALRCVYRALEPVVGAVRLDNTELSALSLRRTAQSIAALTQESASEFDLTVEEIVALGRTPHQKGNECLSDRERNLCRESMERLGVLHLAQRGVLSLSGGERQRVLVARALVQEPRVLVLDEPTNHLDLQHQIELLKLLKESELTVLVVLHDVNLAAAVCDLIGVLSQGRIVAVGEPSEVVTPELVREVFGVDATVVTHPDTGDPQLLYSLN